MPGFCCYPSLLLSGMSTSIQPFFVPPQTALEDLLSPCFLIILECDLQAGGGAQCALLPEPRPGPQGLHLQLLLCHQGTSNPPAPCLAPDPVKVLDGRVETSEHCRITEVLSCAHPQPLPIHFLSAPILFHPLPSPGRQVPPAQPHPRLHTGVHAHQMVRAQPTQVT